MDKRKLTFEIIGDDYDKLLSFEKKHKSCFDKYHDFTGALFSYTFIPTGVGTAITVSCPCGEELRIGDFFKC